MNLKNGFRSGFKCLSVVFGLLLLLGSTLMITEKQQDAVPVYAEEESVTDFVSRLYTVILERTPDESGLNEWTGYLQSGTYTGAEVAEGFIMSDEFLGKDMSNEEFVQIMYRAFFGREADASGLETWVDFLDEGYRKSYVFAGFANSTEFGSLCEGYGVESGFVPVTISEQQPNLSEEEYNIWLFVERMYTEVLERTPDMSGIREWVEYLQHGTYSGAEVSSGFILSDEFQAKEMTNEEYVQIMYRAFFGREADPSGLETWVNALETDYTKEYVFAGFANSNEFGMLCENYGITQGSVDIFEPEPDVSYVKYSVVVKENGVEYSFSEGGVIIFCEDGLYGAMDYDGNEIVSNEFSEVECIPNSEGYFALADAENVYVFDKYGVNVYTLQLKKNMDDEGMEYYGLDNICINEGVVTYSYCYCGDDLYASRYAYDLRIDKEIDIEHLTWCWSIGQITAMKNDQFYFSEDFYVYSINRNGELTKLYYNPYGSLPGGEIWFAETPGDKYGLIIYRVEEETELNLKSRLGLLSTDGTEISVIHFDELKEVLGKEETTSVIYRRFYEDGISQANHGKMVAIGFAEPDGTKFEYYLLDFSKAEYKNVEISKKIEDYTYTYEQKEKRVSNIEELVVAEYDMIELSADGIYLACENENYFYIDGAGNVLAEYDDCSSFYNGYAAVMEDGYAYLVDTEFNRVSELFEAELVYNLGTAFAIENEEQIVLLVMEE